MDYESWLKELSERSGASVEQSDITNLQGKNPEDVDMFKRDLEAQYQRRGASQTTGSGPDSTAVRAPSDMAKGTGLSRSSSPTQSWLSASSAPASGAQVQRDPRSDALYQQLLGRSQQGPVDANDPIIRGQVDAASAQATRERRNYISDVAEKAGPLANIAGETRAAGERQGQMIGQFQAELMGREAQARRDEIAQALMQMQGMLTADQEANLRRELAEMDAQLGREGLSNQRRGQDIGFDSFLRDLALREFDTGNRWDYAWSGF